MGRNVNPEPTPIVPINGSVFRNFASNGVIVEATGAVFYPSSLNGILSTTDFPKYIQLNLQSLTSISGTSSLINPSVTTNGGSIAYYPSWSPSLNQYSPYVQNYAHGYCPFIGQRGINRFLGKTANSGVAGTPTVMQYQQLGYQYGSTYPVNPNPVFSFSSSGVPIAQVTNGGAFICWYDSSTSTYRVLSDPSYTSTGGGTTRLYTSSDAITWSNSLISAPTSPNVFGYYYSGNQNYYRQGAIASNQKVFTVLSASSSSANYALFRSTNGGATMTDVTTNVTGTATTYFALQGNVYNGLSLMYDGTTLFIPIDGGAPRWSTNDGTTFSNITVTGAITSLNSFQPKGCTLGANASTFMWVNDTYVAVTTDGGQNFTTYAWTPAATISSSYNNFMPMDYDTVNSRWCFLYTTVSGVYAARSTNNGATWSHSLVDEREQRGFSSTGYLFYAPGDAFYAALGGTTVYRSTDAATWTFITSTTAFGYGAPYFALNDYVSIGNRVIKKSDQSVYKTYGTTLSGVTNTYRTFGNYVSSDLWVSMLYNLPGFVQTCTSSNMNSVAYYAPYANATQQTSNTSGTIEYWRIK